MVEIRGDAVASPSFGSNKDILLITDVVNYTSLFNENDTFPQSVCNTFPLYHGKVSATEDDRERQQSMLSFSIQYPISLVNIWFRMYFFWNFPESLAGTYKSHVANLKSSTNGTIMEEMECHYSAPKAWNDIL